MKKFSSLKNWLSRGWSFHAFIVFVISHIVLLIIFKDARETINSIISLVAQLLGGIILIIIILLK